MSAAFLQKFEGRISVVQKDGSVTGSQGSLNVSARVSRSNERAAHAQNPRTSARTMASSACSTVTADTAMSAESAPTGPAATSVAARTDAYSADSYGAAWSSGSGSGAVGANDRLYSAASSHPTRAVPRGSVTKGKVSAAQLALLTSESDGPRMRVPHEEERAAPQQLNAPIGRLTMDTLSIYASQPLGHAALGGTFSELLREQHMLKPSAPDHEELAVNASAVARTPKSSTGDVTYSAQHEQKRAAVPHRSPPRNRPSPTTRAPASGTISTGAVHAAHASEASHLTKEKMLAFSRKPREVEHFRPYTLQEYDSVHKADKYLKLGGLGANISDEVLEKREKQDRIKAMAADVKRSNAIAIAQARELEAHKPKRPTPPAAKPTARDRAREFAKNVPKPKVALKKDEDAIAADPSELDLLSMQYEESKREIEAIRREFGS